MWGIQFIYSSVSVERFKCRDRPQARKSSWHGPLQFQTAPGYCLAARRLRDSARNAPQAFRSLSVLLAQRAQLATLAPSERCSGVIASARARPPGEPFKCLRGIQQTVYAFSFPSGNYVRKQRKMIPERRSGARVCARLTPAACVFGNYIHTALVHRSRPGLCDARSKLKPACSQVFGTFMPKAPKPLDVW